MVVVKFEDEDPLSNYMEGIRNNGTRRQAKQRLKYFFDSIYCEYIEDTDTFKLHPEISLEEQVKEFMLHKDDTKYIEKCFKKFCRVQKNRKDVAGSTVWNYYKAIKLFCKMNDINVNWAKLNNLLPENNKSAKDRIPTVDEIKTLVRYTDRRIKPIVYTMLSCGMRLEAWSYLQWNHITPIIEDDKIVGAKIIIYAGEREEYYSFITPEAYNLLKEWMDFRSSHGEYITGDSWVMRTTFDTIRGMNKNNHLRNNLDISTPRKLSHISIKTILERAAKSQNLFKPLEVNQHRRAWKLAHGLRKFFKTKCENASLRSISIEMLLGHDIGLDASYHKPTDKELFEDYKKAINVLTIDTDTDINIRLLEQEKQHTQEITAIENRLLRFEYSSWIQECESACIQQIREDTEEELLRLQKTELDKVYTMTQDQEVILDVDEQIKNFKQYYKKMVGRELDEKQIQALQIKPKIIKVHRVKLMTTRDNVIGKVDFNANDIDGTLKKIMDKIIQ